MTNYVYAGEFVFDSSLTLVKASSDVKFYTVANWDAEGHKPVDSSKVYEEMKTEVKDIVFGTPATVTKENSSIEVDDYFVSSIEGEPVLSGMTGKDSSGNPAFVVGDAPSLSTDTKYLPISALNFTGLALTSCSDETALEEDWWTEKTVFTKEGTFTLYFGDVVNPKLVSATVTVLPKPKTVPYFWTSSSTFKTVSEKGNEVSFDSENDLNSITIYLDEGADRLTYDFYNSYESPYDTAAIALSGFDSSIVDASVEETESGADLVLAPKAVGDTTITFKTDAVVPAADADWASNRGSIKVTVVATRPSAPSDEIWDAAVEAWGDLGILYDLVKPDFEYTDIDVLNLSTMIQAIYEVRIYTPTDMASDYLTLLKENGYVQTSGLMDYPFILDLDGLGGLYTVTLSYDWDIGAVIVHYEGQ